MKSASAAPAGDCAVVQGVTISCQTNGREWGTDGFERELDDLQRLGVNWVAIHPYGQIHADGSVTWRELDPLKPPDWIARPIRAAHERGMSILVIPHIAYWGSPWRYRSEIEFDGDAARARFFATYAAWITNVARAARGADAFSLGNELDRLVRYEQPWRTVIAALRAATSAKLTYAAQWSSFESVPFWDALDAIGVDAYFPLCSADDPDEASLRKGWSAILPRLKALHERTGKPVVFTELGYNASLDAARTPWTYRQARGAELERAEALQDRCMSVALSVIAAEKSWLRGAFLWKWFVGPAPGENFLLTTPRLRAAIGRAWKS